MTTKTLKESTLRRLKREANARLTSPKSWATEKKQARDMLRVVDEVERLCSALNRIAQNGCTRGGCCSACGAGEDEDCGDDCCKLVARNALEGR